MGKALEPKFITAKHYRAFGRVVQAFVQIETVYAQIVLRVLKVEDGTGAFLLAGYNYDGLKNLVKSMVGESNLPDHESKEILARIDKVNDKANLRNNVAHNPWKPGKRKGSIKSMVLKTKGNLKIMGIEDNEKDWLASELDAEADEILRRGMAVGQFFVDRGIHLGLPKVEKRKK